MKTILKTLMLGALIIGVSQATAQAQLATYTVTTSNDAHNTSDPNDVAATQSLADSVAAPVTDLVMGPGLSAQYAFGYSVGDGKYYPTTLADSNSGGVYLTFTITPEAGTVLDLTDIDFTGTTFQDDAGVDNSGYTAALTSNVDGYTTDLGNDTTFDYLGEAGMDVTLGSEFSHLTSATTFELNLYGMTSDQAQYVDLYLTDGSFINVNGTSTPSIVTPEPSTYALMGLGLAVLLVTLRTRRASAV